jgi:hypothetical protein
MNKTLLLAYALGFLLKETDSFAVVIRTETCIIPFDVTIKSLCVFSTLGLWIGIPLIIGLLASIFRSK